MLWIQFLNIISVCQIRDSFLTIFCSSVGKLDTYDGIMNNEDYGYYKLSRNNNVSYNTNCFMSYLRDIF